MSSETSLASVFCGNCGEPVATRFCTHCKAKNLEFVEHQDVSPQSAGWTDVIDDVMGAERHKLWVTTRSLMRSPVATTLSLTENGEYTGHFKLMATWVVVSLTFVTLAASRLLTAFLTLPPETTAVLDENVKQLRVQLLITYPSIFMMTFVQYYFLSLFSKVKRTPKSYYKLCMISVAFGSVMQLICFMLWVAVSLALGLSGRDWVLPLLALAMFVSLIAAWFYIFGHHRKFWSLPKSLAAVLITAFFVLTFLLQMSLVYVFTLPVIQKIISVD